MVSAVNPAPHVSGRHSSKTTLNANWAAVKSELDTLLDVSGFFDDEFGAVEGTFIRRGSLSWAASFLIGEDLPNPAVADLGGVFALPYGSSAGASNGPFTTTSVLAGIDLNGNPQRAAVTGSAGPVVLANAPTLVSPNASDAYYLSSTKLAENAANYRVFYTTDGRDALNLGNTSVSSANLHKATTHSFNSALGTQFAQFDATGLTVTAQNASALKVGRLGGTTPAFQVDSATASSITGVKVTAAASGGGVNLAAIGETNVALTLDSAGSGVLRLNQTGTGAIVAHRDITLSQNTNPTLFMGNSGNCDAYYVASGASGRHLFTSNHQAGYILILNGVNNAANYLSITPSITAGGGSGNPITVQANGSDTNVPLGFSTKGNSAINWYTDSFVSLQVQFTHTASANRALTLTGSNGGNPTIGVTAGKLAVSAALVLSQTTLLETSATLTNGAAAATGTLTNAPAAGNPTKWIPINDNGTTRYIPAW